MRNSHAKNIALGGMLAAIAIVIMCLGGMIPLATFICPMLCMLVQYLVLCICGRRIAWAWFAVVAILGLLIAPDKEASLVFCLLGEYPIIKPWLEKSRVHVLWKIILFNSSVALLYGLLLRLFGLDTLAQEYATMGTVGLLLCLILGNITFILMDRLLSILSKRDFRKESK